MDEDNNNNNADDDQEVDPDFNYHQDQSTTCIFLRNSTSDFILRWRHHRHRNSRPSYPSNSSSAVVVSSSAGLLLCYRHFFASNPPYSTPAYYVGNPFHEDPYLTHFTPQPHFSNTHTVLSAGSNGIYYIISLIPKLTGSWKFRYTLNAYSSVHRRWLLAHNSGTHLDNDPDRVIIPNSGISCSWSGYWLTWLRASRSDVSVARVDGNNLVNQIGCSLLTYMKIPSSIQQNGVGIRMALGRAGTQVGLVVVDEVESKVELYLMVMNEEGNIMKDWMLFPSLLKVEVDPTMEEGAVEVVGLNRIKCQEMPQPMRFESFKVEVLLSVRGGQRVVDSKNDFARTRVFVADGWVAGAAVNLAALGVPHVSTSVVPA